MEIIWEEKKNQTLILERSVSFEEISEKILDNEILDIRKNPTRENQQYFILSIRGYIWVVPYLLDDKERIILKTAYPSRKYHKFYGGK
jgi:uncharacterized DUF497 family protein